MGSKGQCHAKDKTGVAPRARKDPAHRNAPLEAPIRGKRVTPGTVKRGGGTNIGLLPTLGRMFFEALTHPPRDLENRNTANVKARSPLGRNRPEGIEPRRIGERLVDEARCDGRRQGQIPDSQSASGTDELLIKQNSLFVVAGALVEEMRKSLRRPPLDQEIAASRQVQKHIFAFEAAKVQPWPDVVRWVHAMAVPEVRRAAARRAALRVSLQR